MQSILYRSNFSPARHAGAPLSSAGYTHGGRLWAGRRRVLHAGAARCAGVRPTHATRLRVTQQRSTVRSGASMAFYSPARCATSQGQRRRAARPAKGAPAAAPRTPRLRGPADFRLPARTSCASAVHRSLMMSASSDIFPSALSGEQVSGAQAEDTGQPPAEAKANSQAWQPSTWSAATRSLACTSASALRRAGADVGAGSR